MCFSLRESVGIYISLVISDNKEMQMQLIQFHNRETKAYIGVGVIIVRKFIFLCQGWDCIL